MSEPVIISTTPATWTSTLPQVRGQQFPIKDAVQHTYSDGTTDFACTVCGYTNSKARGIQAHAVVHRPHAKWGSKTGRSTIAPMDALYEMARDLTDAVDALRKEPSSAREELESWKKRAKEAERQLSTLRRVLAP